MRGSSPSRARGGPLGLPTVFIRLSGCNLDCRWCDTRYAEEGGSELSVDEVLACVKGYRTRHVCLTGGEPLWHEGTPELISRLLEEGKQVSLETNGRCPLPVSPTIRDDGQYGLQMSLVGNGEAHAVGQPEASEAQGQAEVVVSDKEDLERAEDVLRKYAPDCPAIFTPVGGLTLAPVVEYVLKHRREVRVLPQLHKLIWGERRGV